MSNASAMGVGDGVSLSRRRFLEASAAATGGLLLTVSLPASSRAAASASAVTAWVRIGTDESVTILIGAAEMGQGVLTGLPQILAEELMVDWTKVKAEHAPVDPVFNSPFFHAQATGGSTSVRAYFQVMRVAGAAAREMLIAAASQRLGVPAANLRAASGVVWVNGTSTGLTYGQLAPLAATLTPPTDPPLTPSDRYRLIGRSMPRTDLGGKVDGSAQFGIDTRLPNMVYAAIKHGPKFGATLAATPATPAGALALVPLGDAFAVVATNTWNAFRLANQVQATWTVPTSSAQIDSAVITSTAQTLMANGPVAVAERVSDAPAAFAGAARVLEWTYDLPYLAHGCLEPLNCTASVTANACEVWAPTQAITGAAAVAAQVTGLPPSAITVHTTFLGGGLGRKGEQDFVRQAVRIAKAVGRPVKLTWSREEDFTRDFYRPMALSRIRVALDASGQVLGWANRLVSPSILISRAPAAVANGIDSQATEGATALPYQLGARLIEYAMVPGGPPVGFWRSVGHSLNAFATESAIDELAAELKVDPVAFRLRLLANDPRSANVLKAAADLIGWGAAPPAGSARGVALHASFNTIVAQIAEISLVGGAVRVNRIACAVDCGLAINPDNVEAQIQSGIVHGLSAALWGRIGFNRGAADTRNFNAYRLLRLREMPQVLVKIINSGEALGGIGEPGVPPVAPAIANAYATLTGKRLRSLPLFPGARAAGGGGD